MSRPIHKDTLVKMALNKHQITKIAIDSLSPFFTKASWLDKHINYFFQHRNKTLMTIATNQVQHQLGQWTMALPKEEQTQWLNRINQWAVFYRSPASYNELAWECIQHPEFKSLIHKLDINKFSTNKAFPDTDNTDLEMTQLGNYIVDAYSLELLFAQLADANPTKA